MMDVELILTKMQDMDLIRLGKPVGDYYQVYCPIHNNGQEKKPSCGVLLRDQYKNGKLQKAGFTHCFRGDTRVLTSQGSIAIADLCDATDVQIINGNGDWETTTFRNYGNAQLWKIELSRDQVSKVIYATADHEWFVRDRLQTYTTDSLKPGMYLQSVVMKPLSFDLVTDAIIHGIIYGDGTRSIRYKSYGTGSHRVHDTNIPMASAYSINIPKFSKKHSLVNYFLGNPQWSMSDTTINGNPYHHVWSKSFPVDHNYKLPPLLSMGRDYLMSFLAGYFACDGSIDLMKLHSSKIDQLNTIRDICIHCGISVLDMRVLVHDTNYKGNATLGSFRMYPNSIPPEFYLLDLPKQSNYSRSRWKVVSVKPTDSYEDVYCCETSTHSFVLDGNILTHNCFSCGWAKPLPDTISSILKNKHISKSGIDWLKENIPGFEEDLDDYDYLIPPELSQDLSAAYSIQNIMSMMNQNKASYVPESELATYRMTVPYMYERGLTDEIIERFDIGYDANFIPPGRKNPVPCVTFPVRDLNGNTLFLCRRSVVGKMFNYPQGVEKSVYGIYECPKNAKSVIICESCFNALTAIKYGYNAVALLGTGTSYEIKQLKQLGVSEFVLCLDGDSAGQKGADKLKRALSQIALVWTIHMPVDKDLNDCTEEEFRELYAQRE